MKQTAAREKHAKKIAQEKVSELENQITAYQHQMAFLPQQLPPAAPMQGSRVFQPIFMNNNKTSKKSSKRPVLDEKASIDSIDVPEYLL